MDRDDHRDGHGTDMDVRHSMARNQKKDVAGDNLDVAGNDDVFRKKVS